MVSDSRLQGVLLDLDGLLLDTESIYCRAWQKAAQDQDRTLSNELYVSSVLGRSNIEGEQRLLQVFGAGFSIEGFRTKRNELWRRYIESTAADDLRKPGAEDFLGYLESRNLPVAVATSSNRKDAEESLRAARLDGLVNLACLVTEDDVAIAKPDPQIYREAAARLNLAPADCVVVEDSSPGVNAARAAGMKVIVVPDMERVSEETSDLCFRVADSLFDVKRAIAQLLTT